MKRVLIIGAGDLGQQIAHYITTDSNEYCVAGFVDDWGKKGDMVGGNSILGAADDIERLYQQNCFDELLIGIGYKHFTVRKALFERYKDTVPFATFVHSTCFVDNTASIGNGCVILPNCTIDMESSIHDNVMIYSHSHIGHNSVIEAHTIVSGSVQICGFAHIDEQCFIGASACIGDHKHIIHNTIVGAGAVVMKDITVPNGVYVGVPAHLLEK